MTPPERIDPTTDIESDNFMAHIARYRFALPYVQGKKVLDVGCGKGYGSYYLRNLGAKTVTGIDITKNDVIDFANRYYIIDGLNYIHDDFIKISRQEFDVITAFEFIEHVKDPAVYLRKMWDCLTDYGLLLISTPYLTNPYIKDLDRKNPYHISTRARGELENLLRQSGFKDIRVIYQERSLTDRKQALIYGRLEKLYWGISAILSSLISQRLRKLLGRPSIILEDHSLVDLASIYHWKFSLFPKTNSEVVLFVCSKDRIDSLDYNDIE